MNKNTGMIIVAIAIVVIAAMIYTSKDRPESVSEMEKRIGTPGMMEKTGDAMMKVDGMRKGIVVAMGELNNSKQSGKATLTDMGGKTKVMVEVASGVAGIPQPSHIHMGSCKAPGDVLYPLTAVVNGKAESVLDVSLETIGSKLPLLVMVHKSKDEAKIFVSCGDLPVSGFGTAMMEKKGDAMVKGDAMMTAGDAMMKVGSYEAYAPEKIAKASATGNVVLNFSATWCPTCRALEADIKANLKNIPGNLTILRVDYDNSADLKKKYGVTYQHTMVQVDKNGTMIKKWMGSQTLSAFVAEVK
ncbi:MAG: thioredoxin family protein [Patescibacteria group bacterium]